jgi:hypothetical protein
MSKYTVQEARDKWSTICLDPYRFISKLKIIDKKGALINFVPNEEQIKIIEALESEEDCLVLKGRQIGSSTAIAAYYFWKIYTAKSPVKFAILSHKLESSKELFKMHKTFYENLPEMFRKPTQVYNTTQLKFADSGASIIATSAGADGGLRSFTCSYLQLSEYAFAPNPEELKATALNALNEGQFIMESTANYFNDALHQEILKCERGEADWKYLFFPWFMHSEYSEECGKLEYLDGELELKNKFDLDDSQIKWRRSKIAKIGLEKFKREFPTSCDEAYSQVGNTYLTEEDLSNITVILVEPIKLVYLSKVQMGDSYAIGVDVAAGVNRDYSVITVVSKKTHQVCAIYRCNKTTPVELAEWIIKLGTEYNMALALVESNNYGNVVLNELRHQGWTKIWKDSSGADWQTTGKSKIEMFENLKYLIKSGYITSCDNITFAELRALQVDEMGRIIIPDTLQSHGDSAIAIALAYIALAQVELKKAEFLPQWITTKRIDKIVQKSGISVSSKRRY